MFKKNFKACLLAAVLSVTVLSAIQPTIYAKASDLTDEDNAYVSSESQYAATNIYYAQANNIYGYGAGNQYAFSDSDSYDYSSDSYDYDSDTYDSTYDTNTYDYVFGATDLSETTPIVDGDVTIIDSQNLLQDTDAVEESMQNFTPYGKAVFISTAEGYRNASSIETLYDEYIGHGQDGMLFLIDMNSRQILIYTDGSVHSVINEAYANTITDNAYKKASDGDYDDTVEAVFDMAVRLMSGQKVAQPMRAITSFFMAICIAFIISFLIIKIAASGTSIKQTQISDDKIMSRVLYSNVYKHTHEYRSSDTSVGGGGSSGGGGGGGGSSGGGGGHSF